MLVDGLAGAVGAAGAEAAAAGFGLACVSGAVSANAAPDKAVLANKAAAKTRVFV